MSLGIGLARALTGFSQGMQQEDERRRVLTERAQMRAAAELKDRLDRERQAKIDAQNAESNNLARTLTLAQMQQMGVRQGKAPQAASFFAPGLLTDTGVSTGPIRVEDRDRFTQLSDGFYMDRNATPEFQAQQKARVAATTAKNEATAAQQAQEAQRQQILASLPANIRQRAAGLPLNTLVALQSSALTRDMTPREPRDVNMQVIQTADGPMAFDPRTGNARPITAGGRPVRGGTAEQPMTLAQQQAAGFLSRMQESRKIMDAFEQGGALPGPSGTTERVGPINPVRSGLARGAAMLPFVGESAQNALTDPDRQRYWNAASNWVRANLRKESGAAIGVEEMEQEISTYFPRPGDDARTVEQKRRLRQVTEDAMARMANTPTKAQGAPRDESEAAARFRANARAEGYSDEDIDAELRRRGMIR